MTYYEAASAMRRLADVFDKVGKNAKTGAPKPMMSEEMATGAAIMLTYLRDLVTTGNRDVYPREDLLVLLETMSRDNEMFPCGVGRLIWDQVTEDDDEVEEEAT